MIYYWYLFGNVFLKKLPVLYEMFTYGRDRIRIRKQGIRMRGFGCERNIYGSTRLVRILAPMSGIHIILNVLKSLHILIMKI
jgi:hypothetical protein